MFHTSLHQWLTRSIATKSNMAEFGEPRLENVVEYKIFSSHLAGVEIVEDTLYDVLSYAQSLIGDYIWQNDCFNLSQEKENVAHSEQIKFLKGSTNFGDNIEDEWFIVYLLFSITKQFPQLAVTVNDNDGEFLLIEAADYLPKWLEPDTSENRVFICQGNLHIIPLPSKPSEITIFPTGKPTVYQALKVLKTNAEKTTALPWIQDPVMKKIQEYPNKAKESFHNVLCYIPSEVKYLLETKNSLISPAVLAFINRNPVDMKTCQKLTHFSLESLVPYRVRFTKCLYGQLVKQNFIPDKYAVKFLPEVSSPAYKGHLFGLQLTYGFEILYSQQSRYANGVTTPNTASGQQWEKYLDSLTKHGYFQNEVVGSRLYSQLLQNAKEYFTRICLNSEQSQNNSNEIEQLLEDVPVPNKASDQSKPEEFPPDDDESWLELSPEELDIILSQYGLSTGEDVDLREVVNGMNSFVETISSYEGAEFPSDLGEEPDIQFDPEGFMTSLDKFLTKPINRVENETVSDDDSYSSNASDDEEIHEYTSAIDKELSLSNVGKSFVKVQEKSEETSSNKDRSPGQTTEDDAMKPVDIDLNLVQNFLESYSLQEGLPGPVSNILSPLGIILPENLPRTDT